MTLRSIGLALFLSLVGAACSTSESTESDMQASEKRQSPNVIVFVWDGLRPDVINDVDTPNLKALADAGARFSDNHSTYPTFTMMNAASFATGSFSGTTGFYGNTMWAKGTTGADAAGTTIDFNQPIFTEDYSILTAMNAFFDNELLMVGTLFAEAQKAGLKTVAVGKSGPAFMQDLKKGGLILDEKMAWPQTFAKELQDDGFALPKLTPNAHPVGAVALAANNGDPTAQLPLKKLADNASTDPTDTGGSPPAAANAYLMNTYLEHILPKDKPDLSWVWLRNPDSTQHAYGIGTPNSVDALHQQDALLGKLLAKLDALGMRKTTNVIVVSDHAHSTVAGPRAHFPLRTVERGAMGAPSDSGFAASGSVRIADLMSREGFTVYDGTGCVFEPVMSGIKADGSPVYPTQTDADGTVCGTAGAKYTTKSFKVPADLAPDANAVVIAMNGGSDYLYVPSHDPDLVRRTVRFLQSREEFGAVFVGARYGVVPGTIPLETIRAANTAGRNPDIIVSYTYDDEAIVQGHPGTEMNSMTGASNRGMHGSFSPIDVHNTLIASGPGFKQRWVDDLPSGNVDVAPTVARLLGLTMAQADGRPLVEALAGSNARPTVEKVTVTSASEATGVTFKLPTDPSGAEIEGGKSSYGVELYTKQLTVDGKQYTYFDRAKAVRK